MLGYFVHCGVEASRRGGGEVCCDLEPVRSLRRKDLVPRKRK